MPRFWVQVPAPEPHARRRRSVPADHRGYSPSMAAVLLIILLALLLGGVGLAIEALRWVLIVALVLLLVGALGGYRVRSRY